MGKKKKKPENWIAVEQLFCPDFSSKTSQD
jgi:hypothetical protein